MRFVRLQPVALLALFVALAGTGVAAESLVTGAKVRDGSLRSVDVRDGSLRRADFDSGLAPLGRRGPRGRMGPQGPAGSPGPPTPMPVLPLSHARIAADGTVLAGDAVAVAHPEPGAYCIVLPGARWAQAGSAEPNAAQTVAARAAARGEPPCASDATVRVSVTNASGQPEDGPFSLLARTG